MRTVFRRSVEVYIVAVFAILVAILLGCSPGRENEQVHVPAAPDSERPMLGRFRMPSVEESPLDTSDEQCETLNDTLRRDVCYKDSVVGGVLAAFHGGPVPGDRCYQIRSPYLQYMCFRLNFRPHMAAFMSTRVSYPQGAVLGAPCGCADLDEYHALYCAYSCAAGSAKSDLEESKRICRLDNDWAVGECLVYVAAGLVMDFETDTEQKISDLEGLCGGITHPSWKSECYYILADELALFRPLAHISDIADACVESTSAKDYHCFSHVAYLMPIEGGTEMCAAIGDSELRQDCVYGVGTSIGDLYVDDAARAEQLCEGFPEDTRMACFSGLGQGFALHFMAVPFFPSERVITNDVPGAVRRCSQLSAHSRGSCFESLGVAISDTHGSDVASILQDCELFPPEYLPDCRSGAASQTGSNLAYDVSLATEKCALFPGDSEKICLSSVGEAVGRSAASIRSGASACSQLPRQYGDYCFEELISSMRQRFPSADAARETCGEFPLEFQDDCLASAGRAFEDDNG